MTKCCLCNEEFEGHGHNPMPLYNNKRCCTACNISKVIPVRIMLKYNSNGENEKHIHSDEE